MFGVRRLLLVAILVAVVAPPAASAWRTPTAAERARIVAGLPAFYHQGCVRFAVRVSSVDSRYAAVSFRLVRTHGPCSPFDGQVLMRRATAKAAVWRKIGEGSSWPCRVPGVTARVVRDLFGGCAP
jgi:hypothetical protein